MKSDSLVWFFLHCVTNTIELSHSCCWVLLLLLVVYIVYTVFVYEHFSWKMHTKLSLHILIYSFFSIFFSKKVIMETVENPRKRNKPNRYDESCGNIYDMFKEIDQSTPSNDIEIDGDYVYLSDSLSDASNSRSFESTTFEKNGFQKPQERQYARFEAKLNQIHQLLIQIQRARISNATASLLESERIPELPLTSEESLNKFELDLSEHSYRQKIVSIRKSNTVSNFWSSQFPALYSLANPLV